MTMMVRLAPGLIALGLVVPGCASSKPAPAPEEERVVIEYPEEEGEGSETEGEEETPPDDGSPLGVAACDRFTAKYLECSAEMPEEARSAIVKGVSQMRASWRELAESHPASLEESCVVALKAAQDAMGPICPSVVWQ